MQGDWERGRRPPGWSGDDWPDGDWEREEPGTAERRAPLDERGARGSGRYRAGADFDADLPEVMDDPLYDARPGERQPRERHHVQAGRRPERFTGRRARPALSWGQKLLIWVGFALASGVSFGAGLVVGASGGIDVPSIPFLKPAAEEVADPASLEALGPTPDPEGVIEFGEQGRVPSEVEPPPQAAAAGTDKESAPKAEKEAPATRKEAAKSVPEERAPREERSAAVAGTEGAAGEPDEDSEAPAEEATAEMTFYETATGKRAAPGLTATDEEVPAETETEGANAPPAGSPAVRTGAAPEAAEAPSGADLLARRRAIEPETAAAAAPEAAPSGAALLARRQSAGSEAPQATAPAAAASPGETYTVQVSTLADENEARSLADRLGAKGFDVRVVPLTRPGMITLYRVRVGRYPSEAAARADLDRLQREPGTHPYIRME